jgi:hypothetical protein
MSDESDSDVDGITTNPYRDDPEWEPWHAFAVDVQGGADDETTSDEEEEPEGRVISLPDSCVCKNCRYKVHTRF